ncbi:MAG: sugar kinase [Pseudomonadota bacterium]
MTSSTRILCLGEPLVEFVRLEDGLYRRGVGGDTSNAAISAARQGASVGCLTALGADRFGDAVMELWQREGVDTSGVKRDPDAPTGIYFIDPDPMGRAFTYYRAGSAASHLRPRDLPRDLLSSAGVLHLSGITLAVSSDLRETAFSAMELARQSNTAVSIDTNLRLKLWDAEDARNTLHAAMAYAQIAVTSLEDSETLTGLSDPGEIIAHYQSLGPRIVLVTMGAEGCWLGEAAERKHIPSAPAQPVDSTGAGDSFAGAFLAYWLENGDASLAAARAAKVAAATVSGYGAVDPVPYRASIVDDD